MEDARCGAAGPGSNPTLERVVKDIAQELDWQRVRYDTKEGSKAGDNYMGIVQRITIHGEKDGQQKTKSLIYKTEPESKERRERFRTECFFRTEALFYNDILPSFKNFQLKKGLPPSQHFSALPSRCYHAGSTLILEDMGSAGFTMGDRRVAMDVEHCRLVVKALGQFHAISFALKDQDPTEFDRLTSMLQESMFVPVKKQQPMIITHCESMVKSALDNFVDRTTLPDHTLHERLLKAFQENYYSDMIEMVRGANAEPYAVINHGDCWINNMLFKYAKDTRTPKQVCLLDYQLARFASPVTDLVYFFFSCTDKEMRDEHYDQLMAEYHNSLSEFLKQLGSDPEKLFPFVALQDQLKRFGKFGLGMAMLTVPLFMCDPDDVPNMDSTEELLIDMTNVASEVCWNRMNDTIADMFEREYLRMM